MTVPAALKLLNRTQHYDWGSHDELARLMGRSRPSEKPEAEIWMGGHPVAPSQVEGPDGPQLLPDWVAADPEHVLGAGKRGAFPFLVKLLAAAQPLSLQVHPDAPTARAGFAREEAAGLALTDRERCYRDDQPKIEALVALTPFEALVGFRSDTAAEEAIRATASQVALETLQKASRHSEPGSLAGALLRSFLELEDAARMALDADLRRWVDAPSSAAEKDAEGARRLSVLRKLLAQYPGDQALASPLLMNCLCLEPGQGIYLAPGTLHSYVHGLGLEVMTPSDNVVRGGLTGKHVAREELARLLETGAEEPGILTPSGAESGSLRPYPLTDAPFAIAVQELEVGERVRVKRPVDSGPRIVVCTAGGVRLDAPDASTPGTLLGPGESAVVPAATEAIDVMAQADRSGSSQLYWVDTQS